MKLPRSSWRARKVVVYSVAALMFLSPPVASWALHIAFRILTVSWAEVVAVIVSIRVIRYVTRSFANTDDASESAPFFAKAQTKAEGNARELLERLNHGCDVHRFSDRQFPNIVKSLISPRSVFLRTTETYTLLRKAAKKRCVITGVIPSSGTEESGSVEAEYLPVKSLRKGGLIDGFKAFGSGEAELTPLSQDDWHGLAAQALRDLLLNAFALGSRANLPPHVSDIERASLTAILLLGARTSEYEQLGDHWSGEIAGLSVIDEEIRDSAAQFVKYYTSHQPLIVRVVPTVDRQFMVGYEEVVPPNRSLFRSYRPIEKNGSDSALGRPHVALETKWEKWRELLRGIFGVNPHYLFVPLATATESVSYHLRVEGGEGSYLFKQRLHSTPKQSGDEQSAIEADLIKSSRDDGFNYRFGHSRAQSYGQFYTRFYPKLDAGLPEVFARFEFVEVPPGSTFKAAAAAWTTWMLIFIIGTVLGIKDSELSTNAVAFLLVFPAAAAGWIGIDIPANRMLEGAFAARMSLIVTTVSSLAASGLFIAHAELPEEKSDGNGRWTRLPEALTFFGVEHLWWSLLLVLVSTNVVCISYCTYIRARHYTAASK